MPQHRLRRLVALAALAAAWTACARPSTLQGDAPVAIAVVPFALAPGTPPPPIDVAAAIGADLASSGRFAMLPAERLPAHPSSIRDVRYEEWRSANVDYLVIGLVAIVHDGGHDVEFRLVDARGERSVLGFQIPTSPDELPRTSARIAQMIQDHFDTTQSAAHH